MNIELKSQELMQLLAPHRTSNIMQRVQAHVVAKTGKKLVEFLSNGATPEEKTALIDGLITICKTEAWSELPPAAGGQQVAVGATAAPASKPAPAPKPIPVTIKPAVPAFMETKDKGEAVAAAAPAPVDPITAAITALQAAIAAKPAPVAADIGLSVDEVRYVVRKEIASVFRTIAEVLEAQTK